MDSIRFINVDYSIRIVFFLAHDFECWYIFNYNVFYINYNYTKPHIPVLEVELRNNN